MRTRQVVSLLGLSMMLAFVGTQSDGSGAVSARSWKKPDAFRVANANTGMVQNVNTRTPSENTIPIVVDGSKNPELVPDSVAYRHFIMAASIPDRPNKDELARRIGIIRSMRLGDQDAKALVAALRGVRDELNRIAEDKTVQAGALSTPGARAMFKAQRDTVFTGAQARLLGGLSQEGHETVQKFVREHVKTQIKIYGSVPQ
jgi:hypothetical protein